MTCMWRGCTTELPQEVRRRGPGTAIETRTAQSTVDVSVEGSDYTRGKHFYLCSVHAEQAIDVLCALMEDEERAWPELGRDVDGPPEGMETVAGGNCPFCEGTGIMPSLL